MKKIKIITFIALLFLISCKSNDEHVKHSYIDKELKLSIDSYIEDSVDGFSKELENNGGFFMWKNYRDYLGLGDIGFKKRIQNEWNKAYDNETLELFINTQLAKKYGKSNLHIDKSVSEISNYNYILLFPFLTIVMEEITLLLMLFFIIEFIVIPYIAKRTLPREYTTNNFWSSLVLSFLSSAERQNRINVRVAKFRKFFNYILIVIMFVFTIFCFDFNESLNQTLKTNVKKNILENINFKISEQLNK